MVHISSISLENENVVAAGPVAQENESGCKKEVEENDVACLVAEERCCGGSCDCEVEGMENGVP